MRLTNGSRRHPTTEMRRLVDFAARHCRFSDDVVLRVFDAPGQIRVSGQMWHRPGGSSVVHLRLGEFPSHPHFTSHVTEVRVEILTWEEEFLLVLAHELQHVTQCRTGVFEPGHAAEVDAEEAASRVVKAWRAARRRSAPKAISLRSAI